MSQFSFIGNGYVYGQLYKLRSYAAFVLDDSDSKVYGKVFELSEDEYLLKSIDKFEGYYVNDIANSLFVRKKVKTTIENGKQIECWVYVLNQEVGDAVHIPSGRFAEYMLGKHDEPQYCCENMTAQLNLKCDEHPDPFSCPDNLIYHSAQTNQYGLIIHDGGSSFSEIIFCPWCGADLPNQK
jgi:gamma-glutamylcyclotransferase (GGCT)/AIG2-like uncharacterized protein YtfP